MIVLSNIRMIPFIMVYCNACFTILGYGNCGKCAALTDTHFESGSFQQIVFEPFQRYIIYCLFLFCFYKSVGVFVDLLLHLCHSYIMHYV
mgnify:CR=1 FL=1